MAEGADLKTIKGEDPTLLFYAASPEVAELLIQKGVNVNARDSSGGTALKRIAMMPFGQSAAIVRVLLEHGADPNATTSDGISPLMKAASPEIVDLLIRYGANIKALSKDKISVIQSAPVQARSGVFEALVRHGVPFDVKKDGPTLLLHAVWAHNTDLIGDLLTRGVDPNVKGVWAMRKGKPVLMLPLTAAVIDGGKEFESVKLLLDHGAKATDEMSNAIYNRQAGITKFFWDHGVRTIPELTYQISQGASAADLKKLIAQGNPVDPPLTPGMLTPLEDASLLGNMDAIKLLVSQGADVNRSVPRSHDYPVSTDSPLACAAAEGQDEIVHYLLDHGARADYRAVWEASENSDPYENQRPRSHFEAAARLLIDAGGLKKLPGDLEGYLLSAAIETRHGGPNATVLKMLLAAGLNPRAPMPYIVDNGEKPNSVIGYYRDFYIKYKEDPTNASHAILIKPLLEMLEAADKGGVSTSLTQRPDGDSPLSFAQKSSPDLIPILEASTQKAPAVPFSSSLATTPPPPPIQKSENLIEVSLKVFEISEDAYRLAKTKIDEAIDRADLVFLHNVKGMSGLYPPSVATRPGQSATIQVVREFPYPTSFSPGKSVPNSLGGMIYVSPTPQKFANKDVGVTAEITPALDDGNSSSRGKIILTGNLTVTTFAGFTKSNFVGPGMPSFNTTESNFVETLKDKELKGFWIPGEHMAADNVPAFTADAGKLQNQKRYLLFVSAKWVQWPEKGAAHVNATHQAVQ